MVMDSLENNSSRDRDLYHSCGRDDTKVEDGEPNCRSQNGVRPGNLNEPALRKELTGAEEI